jgi:3-oxoacyl-[acyl-carrier-protein] synthase I
MLNWLKPWRDEAADTSLCPHNLHDTSPMASLDILARGMCCALGHTAPAATAALNANLNQFVQSEFVNGQGKPVTAGIVHGLPSWGVDRLAQMLRQVVRETLVEAQSRGMLNGPQQSLNTQRIVLLINGPQATREGLPQEALQEAIDEVLEPWAFHSASSMRLAGSGDIAGSLRLAARLLTDRPLTGGHVQAPTHVLLVGLDSLLFAGSIEQLIAQDRLLTSETADALIPAEGCGAVLLRLADAPNAANEDPPSLLRIEAAQSALDPWCLYGSQNADQPQRGLGLTQAVRAVLKAANSSLPNIDFQLSGMTGEGWCARETALMLSRCMTHKRSNFMHLTPAQFMGYCGAALPVLALAWLSDVMGRSDNDAFCPGRSALLHFADPEGTRSALVLRHAADPKYNRKS